LPGHRCLTRAVRVDRVGVCRLDQRLDPPLVHRLAGVAVRRARPQALIPCHETVAGMSSAAAGTAVKIPAPAATSTATATAVMVRRVKNSDVPGRHQAGRRTRVGTSSHAGPLNPSTVRAFAGSRSTARCFGIRRTPGRHGIAPARGLCIMARSAHWTAASVGGTPSTDRGGCRLRAGDALSIRIRRLSIR